MERRRALGLVAALFAALVIQLAYGAKTDGVTIDELVYIHAGYRHLYDRDFRLNPEQPPAAKEWAAIGLLGMPLTIDPPEKGPGDQWTSAFRFIHVDNVSQPVVGRARGAALLLAVLLVLVVAAWAFEVSGPRAALIATALLAFHPSILAHGHLVTTDVPAALTMVLTSWTFWRWCERPSLGRASIVAVCLGLGVATRLTTILLVPVFIILALLQARSRHGRILRAIPLLAALVVVLAPAIVWATYGFRFQPWPGESVAKLVGEHLGLPGRAVALAEQYRLLPEAYLEGARFILEHNAAGHQTYLLGEVATKGWRGYYLVALGAKSPLAFLALVALGLFGLSRLWRSAAPLALHALLPAIVLLTVMSVGRIQIGERYVLAVYPYLALTVAVGLAGWAHDRTRNLIVVGLFAAQALTTIAAAPAGYLTFFNALAGGRAKGHQVLVDSNLDWGQDLPRLAAWMKRDGTSKVTLAYHGCDDPDRYGILHEDLPGAHLYRVTQDTGVLHGVVAISPNMLVGLFDPPGNPRYRALQERLPDARAGSLFIYKVGEPGIGSLPY